MPNVRGKEFPYTKKGIAAAKRYAAKYKKGGVVKKNKSKRSRKR